MEAIIAASFAERTAEGTRFTFDNGWRCRLFVLDDALFRVLFVRPEGLREPRTWIRRHRRDPAGGACVRRLDSVDRVESNCPFKIECGAIFSASTHSLLCESRPRRRKYQAGTRGASNVNFPRFAASVAGLCLLTLAPLNADAAEGALGRPISGTYVAPNDYRGSLRSVQRYWRRSYPAPALRARRRVETPAGAQSQVDWAHFPGVIVGGEGLDLLALHMVLSHSRHEAVVWSLGKDLLSWLDCHTEAFKRLGGNRGG